MASIDTFSSDHGCDIGGKKLESSGGISVQISIRGNHAVFELSVCEGERLVDLRVMHLNEMVGQTSSFSDHLAILVQVKAVLWIVRGFTVGFCSFLYWLNKSRIIRQI